MATCQQYDLQSHTSLDQGLNQQALGMTAANLHGEDAFDPVEAYFECITTCSLDDGECFTVCTQLLREQV